MENKIIDFFNKHNLVLEDETLIVGVSTGVDSMVLLEELIRARDIIGFKIICAHINHQLREQSKTEEEFITNYCKLKNVKLEVKHLDFKNDLSNFQAEARDLRYEFFYDLARKYNSQYLLLAHHANDQIETVFMRLLRGSNLAGYSGMSELSIMNDIYILRPLLDTLKEELYNHAKKRDIKYFEDESNFSDVYTRNRIRNHIVPEFFKENPQFHLQLNHFTEMISFANELLTLEVLQYIDREIKVTKDKITFSLESFLLLDNTLQREVLFALTKDYFLSLNNIKEIEKIVFSNKPNVISEVKKDLYFVKEYDKAHFVLTEIKEEQIDIIIDGIGVYDLGDGREIVVKKINNKILTKSNILWYNSNMLPVRVRSRKDGDRISLSGGTKKISDLLIDEKIGILTRKSLLLLVDNDDEVLAIFNLTKSEILKSVDDCDIIIELKENI